ncbi:MAG: amidase, partial [Alicyclobacillus sp.]|nr:amidase [Alicyclobacillus sp.]
AQGLPVGPLAGVPIAVKDLFDTADMPTTYGGRQHTSQQPAADATAVQRLRAAGAILLGKTNLHEYAYGTTNENPHYGPARNPWNRAKITGGSSGGSSAALAAGLALAALGTDTGGSIRIPAALCGHVGFKPSFGLVSKAGVFPLAPSLDHVGPMTQTVADAATLMAVLAGPDPRDPDAVRQPALHWQRPAPRQPIRVGIPRTFFYDKCHSGVLQTVQAALHKLQDNRFVFVEVDVPLIHEVPEAQACIIASEALAVHEPLLKRSPERYGADVRQRLTAGYEVRGHQYVLATQFRRRFRAALTELFTDLDALVTPTTPLTATDIGQQKAHIRAHEVYVRAHLTRYTNPWNLSGLPAVSLPCGLAPDGLPVGLQWIGPPFADDTLLAIAQQAEAALGWQPVAPEYR